MPRVLVCIEGSGWLEGGGSAYGVDKGEVWLLPAVVGACEFHPNNAVTLLEIAMPESSKPFNNERVRVAGNSN
jgi:mannose-6-phosphate isomerase